MARDWDPNIWERIVMPNRHESSQRKLGETLSKPIETLNDSSVDAPQKISSSRAVSQPSRQQQLVVA